MLEVKNLTKIYNGGVKAVDNISFKFERGKIYGFLGPNGAGKSTTMNMITGYLAATSGTVTINGYDIFKEPKKAKACIGYLPEIPPLYTELTPYEYLTICAGMKSIPKNEREVQIAKAIKRTGLEKMKERLIKNLSKGYKQRVGLAQALLGEPDIIILDEPTVGLDPIQIIEIRDLIKSLKKDHTVVLSSHILSEIQEVCDQIIIINKGHLVAEDSTDNISSGGREVLILTVKGKTAAIRSEILKCAGEDVAISFKPSSEPDCIDVRVECEQGRDLREDLSYAFAIARMPIIAMQKQTASLEEVFIEYTKDDKPKQQYINSQPSASENKIFEENDNNEINHLSEDTNIMKGDDQ